MHQMKVEGRLTLVSILADNTHILGFAARPISDFRKPKLLSVVLIKNIAYCSYG